MGEEDVKMEIQQLQKIRAVFSPSEEHKESLIEESLPYVGQEFVFTQVWTAEEGKFKGERIYIPDVEVGHEFWRWVPESDLDIIEVIGRSPISR